MANKQAFGSGTTCHEYLSFIEEYRGYYIYHHKSHRESLNRFDGGITCRAAYRYIEIVTMKCEDCGGYLSSHSYHGRKSDKSLREVKAMIDQKIEACGGIMESSVWEPDKNVDDFLVVADNLEKEGQQSRADVVRYLIARVKRIEHAIMHIL